MDEAAASSFAMSSALSEEFERALKAKEGFFVRFDVLSEKTGGLPVIDVPLAALTLQLARRVKIRGRLTLLTDWFVGCGKWERWLSRIDTTPVYREVETLLAAGGDYRSTDFFRRFRRGMETGRPLKRNEVPLDTLEKFEAYAQSVRRLAESIEKQGVKRRSTFGVDDMAASSGLIRPAWVEAIESEIGAAILADGSIARLGPGHHRTAAAKLGNTASMPVEIRLIHSDWLKRQIANSGLAPWPALIQGINTIAHAKDRPA